VLLGLVAGALSAGSALAAAPAPTDVDPASSPFVQELLRKTEAQREQRKKERLRDYDKRNFGACGLALPGLSPSLMTFSTCAFFPGDYFSFSSGSARGQLSENDKAIRAWLEQNE
jgi:hypothetical protein